MIYVIGGPARCGKTTLARMARTQIDSQVIAADGVMTGLKEVLKDDWIPEFSYRLREIVYGDDPIETKVVKVRKRDAIVWQFLLGYFKEAAFSEEDVIVEGALWPDLFDGTGFEYKAVYLVDTSESHYEHLIKIKNGDGHSNWMKDIDDGYIERYAKFNVARSKEYVRQCKELGYPYFDLREYTIDEAQKLALAELLS